MNIAFVLSSTEPGRDGMGDYTLSLAAALRSLGHPVLIVALNDRWVSAVESQGNAAGVALERLPSSLPWAERIDRACAPEGLSRGVGQLPDVLLCLSSKGILICL